MANNRVTLLPQSSRRGSSPNSRPSALRHQNSSSQSGHNRSTSDHPDALRSHPRAQSNRHQDQIFVSTPNAQQPQRSSSSRNPSFRSRLLSKIASITNPAISSMPVSETPNASRAPTEHARLGNERTYLPGVAVPTHLQSGNNPTVVPRRSKATSMQTAIPASEVPRTARAKTENADLLDLNRTFADGLRVPTHMQSEYNPTVIHRSSGSPQTTPRSTLRIGSDNGAYSHVEPTLHNIPSSSVQPASSNRPSSQGRPSSNTTPSSNSRPSLNNVSNQSSEPTSNNRPGSNNRPRSNDRPSSNGRPNTTPGTAINGLIPASEYERENAGQTYPAHSHFVSRPPAHAQSILQSSRDREMASRQSQIASMQPDERRTQENWAQSQLQRTPGHSCPQGHPWNRIDSHNGYQCERGGHFVTDGVLAEGNGGIFIVPGSRIRKLDPLWGPYYKARGNDPNLIFAGDPNVVCPSVIEPGGKYKFDKLWRLHPDLTGPPRTQAEVDRINDEYIRLKGPREKLLTLEDFRNPGSRYL